MRTLPACVIVTCVCASTAWSQTSDVDRVTAEIDRQIHARLEAAGIQPAGRARDAEYLRRVWLDIAGRIPPAGDVQDFIEDQNPQKREQVVEKLLSGSGYIVNFARMWRTAMLPEGDTDFQIRFLRPGFEIWVREQLTDDVPLDEMVRRLLTVPIANAARQQVTPAAFYQAKQLKPELLGATTARTFLGLRIECAQCHDHPFDEWSQRQFWSFAAFFATVQGQNPNARGLEAGLRALFGTKTLTIPGTREQVEPTFPGGEKAEIGPGKGPRDALAAWMTARDNPWFARAAANRIWAHHFGVGIVDPVDDFSPNNPPSHPELLDFLGHELAAHDFDVRFLIRAITRSQAYQRTSALEAAASEADGGLFARMQVKGMTGEQFYDSVAQAVGVRNSFDPNSTILGSEKSAFVQSFSDSLSSPTERQKSVLQALVMMNGIVVTRATGLENSFTLRAVSEYPLFDSAECVEALFVATLSRRPTAQESARFVKYVDSGGATGERSAALSDVFWALLNSNEFSLNR